jgi:exopolyphosphatase/pppGpp-phosphohydrolase
MSTSTDNRQRTSLHIGEVQTVIATGSPTIGNARLVMPLGAIQIGRRHFKHETPTALEIEHAIEVIEDELFRIRESVASDSTLYTADEAIRQIAGVAGIDDQGELVLRRDLVEQTFDRLAALAMGRPITQDVIPTNPEFAATLLILREFMHHLQFSSITVTTQNDIGDHNF